MYPCVFVLIRDIMVFLLDHRESFFSGVDQVYVQDSDLTVGKYVDKVAKRTVQTLKLQNSFVSRLVKESKES